MTRKNFKTSVIVARFKHCAGRCEACGIVLKPGGYHADHDNPDGLTGEPTFNNCKILCLPCHTIKTKGDVAAIAKAKRREAKDVGATRPKQTLQSRGFEPSRKRKENPTQLPARKSVAGIPIEVER
jgi:5-methylcytosine-specific restriction enzyme A